MEKAIWVGGPTSLSVSTSPPNHQPRRTNLLRAQSLGEDALFTGPSRDWWWK